MVKIQQEGPFTKKEIISKGFSSDSYIYNKTLGGWKKISEVPVFFSIEGDKRTNTNKNLVTDGLSLKEHLNRTKVKTSNEEQSEPNKKNNEESNILKTDIDFRLKSLLNIFKPSNFSKAHSALKNNNLIPQAMLLKQAKGRGYQLKSKSHRDFEIKMLVSQKVGIMAALGSIARFKQAKDICLNFELEKGALFFDFYLDLYGYYVKNYINIKDVKAILETGIPGIGVSDEITKDFNTIRTFNQLLNASSTDEQRHTFK